MKTLVLTVLFLVGTTSDALPQGRSPAQFVNPLSDTSTARQYFEKAAKLAAEAIYDSSTFYF